MGTDTSESAEDTSEPVEETNETTDDTNETTDDVSKTADGASEPADETTRVWLVERTYSDDEQNIVILVYATPDGEQYLRKERALTSFGDDRPTTAALDASPDSLGTVDDPETRERYAEEATRVADQRDPDDRL